VTRKISDFELHDGNAQGRSPKPRRFDFMIGAGASVPGLPWYARDPKDFRGLEQVRSVVEV
jgi:predicted nucleic acid-binding protein